MTHPRQNSKTRLSYWFPLVRDAGLRVPRTEMLFLTDKQAAALWDFYDGKVPDCLDEITKEVRALGEKVGGPPFFLRTDFTSGKHGWDDTCCVVDPENLAHHIYGLFEYGELADIIGLPTDVFVVREMLDVSAAFTAFCGMPIVKEFRFFVRDGAVEHVQPYWPSEAIEGHSPSVKDWRSRLTVISILTTGDRRYLEAQTIKANVAVPGFWSVDWLWADGWYLIDMALGDESYRWEPGDGQ